jgi:hypothetical protein
MPSLENNEMEHMFKSKKSNAKTKKSKTKSKTKTKKSKTKSKKCTKCKN